MGAVVSESGEITLPDEILEEFDIRPGDEILFFKRLNGTLGFHVRRPRKGAGRGMFKVDGPPITQEEIDAAIGEEVEARYLRTLAQPDSKDAKASS